MSHKIFISSDISVDERLVEIAEDSPESVLLWPWLLTALDDWGRATADAKRLKYTVFPALTTVTPQIITESISRFERMGLIELYEVDGKWFFAVPSETWFKYQTHIRVEKRDNDKSRLPAPPSAKVRAVARDVAKVRAVADKSQPSPSPSLSPSPSPTTNPGVEVSDEGYFHDDVAAERARTPESASEPPADAPMSAAAAATWTKAELREVAQTVLPILKLQTSDLDGLMAIMRQYPCAPPWIEGEAASCADFYREIHRKVTIRLYKNWLDGAVQRQKQAAIALEQQRQQQKQNDEGQHHAALQPHPTATKTNDFDEDRYNTVFAEMVRKQRDGETA